MTPDATFLARLALEYWRASSRRTRAGLDASVTYRAESYFGPSSSWPVLTQALVREAAQRAQYEVRSWEIVD